MARTPDSTARPRGRAAARWSWAVAVLMGVAWSGATPTQAAPQAEGQLAPARLAAEGGKDRLLGGGGRDFASGGAGRDRCTAERERTCER